MITIEELKALNALETIRVSEHAKLRMKLRNIRVKDIMHCIDTGKIIEQYDGEGGFPSCLVLGFSVNDSYMHLVAAKGDGFIIIVTV